MTADTGDHVKRGIKPPGAVAATFFECEECGERSTTPSGFSDTCNGKEATA